jgi:methionyl-tRNA synthetase
MPANEFLNLEGNKLSTSKKLGSLAARIFGRISRSARCLRYALTSKSETRIMILPGKIFRQEIIMN